MKTLEAILDCLGFTLIIGLLFYACVYMTPPQYSAECEAAREQIKEEAPCISTSSRRS